MNTDKSGWTLVDYASEASAASAVAAEFPTHENQLAACIARAEYEEQMNPAEFDLGEGWTRSDYRSFSHVSGAEVSKAADRWEAFGSNNAPLRGANRKMRLFGSPKSAAEALSNAGWVA